MGDPLADLAYCTIGFHLPSHQALESYRVNIAANLEKEYLPNGIPTYFELLDEYKKNIPENWIVPSVSTKEWVFYLALALFRMASIASGMSVKMLSKNAKYSCQLRVRFYFLFYQVCSRSSR